MAVEHNRRVFFGILGTVEVRTAQDVPVRLGGRQLRALLALLLLDAGHVVGVDRLVDGLHGQHPPANATNALQSQVSRLRRVLAGLPGPAGGLLRSHPGGYRLAVDPDTVDVHRFTRLAADGRRALSAGDHVGAADLLGRALATWRGPALVDLAGVPFLRDHADRLEQRRLDVVEDHAEAVLAAGRQPAAPVDGLRGLVAAYPLRERARALLIRALHADGRSAEALTVYAEARRVLADELGTTPSQELTRAHLAVLRDGTPAAAPPAGPARRHLPAQLTSFVGRAGELDRLDRMLAAGRLVTVVGPGGVGKTRLVVEAGARHDGDVCFVDLAPLPTGGTVGHPVADRLGVRTAGLFPAGTATADGHDDGPASGAGPEEVETRLVAALRARPTLLILDNCEHVVADTARLARRLLTDCPWLRVLATSREPLGIIGETLLPLRPLPVGAPGATGDDAAALRLFADRAAAVRPDFAVTDGNLDLVRRICATLDGLPLAIELAAVRLRALALDEVALRLDDRFRLLSVGDRTAAPRHHSLRATVEWSWEPLAEPERKLLRRLAVFPDGATLPAAEHVTGWPGVAEVLAGLVDQSLVDRVPAAGPELADRYRMLETVRAFAADRLAEAGEAHRAHRAHAEYLLELAATADGHLRRHEQVRWLARLNAEHRNLLAALRWATGAEVHLGLRLLAVSTGYWYLRGLRDEVAPVAAALLAVAGDDPPAGLAEEYLLCLLHAVPALPVAHRREWLARAATVLDSMTGPLRQPFLHVLWATVAGPPERVDPGRERLLGDDPWSTALEQFGAGYLLLFQGHPGGARTTLGRALDGFRTCGDRWGAAQALDAMAQLACWRGDREVALAYSDEALRLVAELDAREELAELRCRRADRLWLAGDPAGAGADYRAAAGSAERAGLSNTLARAWSGLGELARHAGDLTEAWRRQQAALRLDAEGWAGSAVRAAVATALGRTAQERGCAGLARRWHTEAVTVAAGLHSVFDLAAAVQGWAGAVLDDGDAERAAWLLGFAVALRGTAVAGDQDVARVAAGARDTLGGAGYARAHQDGATTSRREGLARLRAWLPTDD